MCIDMCIEIRHVHRYVYIDMYIYVCIETDLETLDADDAAAVCAAGLAFVPTF